jgi:hypothetical protein
LAVPEKLTLPAAVGLGREIQVVKLKEIFQDQNLALWETEEFQPS